LHHICHIDLEDRCDVRRDATRSDHMLGSLPADRRHRNYLYAVPRSIGRDRRRRRLLCVLRRLLRWLLRRLLRWLLRLSGDLLSCLLPFNIAENIIFGDATTQTSALSTGDLAV